MDDHRPPADTPTDEEFARMQTYRLWEDDDGTSYLQVRATERVVRVEVGHGDQLYPVAPDVPEAHAVMVHVLSRLARDLYSGRLISSDDSPAP